MRWKKKNERVCVADSQRLPHTEKEKNRKITKTLIMLFMASLQVIKFVNYTFLYFHFSIMSIY